MRPSEQRPQSNHIPHRELHEFETNRNIKRNFGFGCSHFPHFGDVTKGIRTVKGKKQSLQYWIDAGLSHAPIKDEYRTIMIDLFILPLLLFPSTRVRVLMWKPHYFLFPHIPSPLLVQTLDELRYC